MNYKHIIKFWFEELSPKDWWIKDSELDSLIRKKFLKQHFKASQSEFYSWRKSPLGSLAEIIILDQFSRNIFRDQAQAFSQDAQALSLCQNAISKGFHRELPASQLPFLLMPIMHSESRIIHKNFLKYFTKPGLENTYGFELKHKKIIDRFDRYPHRNKILGRTSNEHELEFLKQDGSSF